MQVAGNYVLYHACTTWFSFYPWIWQMFFTHLPYPWPRKFYWTIFFTKLSRMLTWLMWVKVRLCPRSSVPCLTDHWSILQVEPLASDLDSYFVGSMCFPPGQFVLLGADNCWVNVNSLGTSQNQFSSFRCTLFSQFGNLIFWYLFAEESAVLVSCVLCLILHRSACCVKLVLIVQCWF